MQTSFPAPRSAMTFHSPSCRVPRRWPHSEGRGWCHSAAEQHRQVPCPLLAQWERTLLSAQIPAAREAGRMGKKQLQWKVKGMKNALFQLLNIFLPRALQPLCSAVSDTAWSGSAVPGDNSMAVTALPTRTKNTLCCEEQWCWCTPTGGTFLHGKISLSSCCRGFLSLLIPEKEFWTSWYPMGILNLLIPHGNFTGRSFSLFLCTSLHLTQWCFPGTVGHQDVLPALETDPKWMSFADRWSGERGTQL